MMQISGDWQLGKPPWMVPVEVFFEGGAREGVYGLNAQNYGCCFVFTDCTHPQQNVIYPVELIEAWRQSQVQEAV